MNVYKFTPNGDYSGHILVAAHSALEAVKLISTVPFFESLCVHNNCEWEKIDGLEYNKEPCILLYHIIDKREFCRY